MQDLSDRQVMILSPLSQDFLIACLLRQFVMQSLSPACFKLKPIIVSSRSADYRKVIAMPDYRDDEYKDINSVGVFVENNTTGQTMGVSKEAAQRFCSGLANLRNLP